MKTAILLSSIAASFALVVWRYGWVDALIVALGVAALVGGAYIRAWCERR